MLLLIILFGFIIRLIFFTGFINAAEQDEGIYLSALRDMHQGVFNFGNYRNLGEDYLPNPAEIFRLRLMVLLPIFIFQTLFGVSEFVSGIYPLACSMGEIVVVYALGKLLFNKQTGIISAFLISFFPLDVIFSTRIMPEVPLSFFMSLGVLFFFMGTFGKGRVWPYYLLAGICTGLGYMIKPLSLLLIPFFILYILVKRLGIKRVAVLAVGIALALSIEGIYFYSQTGDFFLHQRLDKAEFMYKYTYEPGSNSFWITKWLRVTYLDGEPIFHLKHLFGFQKFYQNVNFFGFFYFLIFASIPLFIILKGRKEYWIFAWFFLLLLFLEFGMVGLRTLSGSALDYLLIFKRERFTSVLIVPGVLIAGFVLSKINKILAIILLSFMLVSSLFFIEQGRNFLISGVESLRVAGDFFNENKGVMVYTDSLAVGMLQYYSHFNENSRYIGFENVSLKDMRGFVMLGGARGVDIYDGVVNKHFGRFNNSNFSLVAEISNPLSTYYSVFRPIKIYKAP